MLEALIGILIFSFGVLGLVGLQAQSMRHVSDAQYRGEAVYLAHSLIASMWADDQSKLAALYQSGGAGYTRFREMVKTLPGGADSVNDPQVVVAPGPAVGSSLVTVSVFWILPGESTANQHNYTTQAVVGLN
ncbi:MAG: pilus assembly protein PilV [Pseudomonadota bacterium]|nr:pilus assembly protein PilV [Pseudomonadota bacterium]